MIENWQLCFWAASTDTRPMTSSGLPGEYQLETLEGSWLSI
jgi:hypothetical protein